MAHELECLPSKHMTLSSNNSAVQKKLELQPICKNVHPGNL
jgi:hypothetical protein